jgi:hypothetical protein
MLREVPHHSKVIKHFKTYLSNFSFFKNIQPLCGCVIVPVSIPSIALTDIIVQAFQNFAHQIPMDFNHNKY